MVVVLLATLAVIAKAPEPFAEPTATEDVQEELLYKVMFELASAVPFTTGELLFAGPVGVTDATTGSAGAIESWT